MFAHLAASLHTLGLTAQSRLRRDEKGATMVEYGLMVALIAVVVVAALLTLGPKIAGLFTKVQGQLGA
ncbi:Flp family type IVb pilin [Arthrobacter pityocampae]|uniref:Flp family type IVb pilin n=1 Tax=Arthrobacter pityocampae TaxID=547334 RepID=UPI003736AD3E